MTRFAQFAAVLATLGVAAVPTFGTRARGVDVSSNQNTINWTQAATGGVEFAWIRSSTGHTALDSKYGSNMANARGAGVLAGAYHYVYPLDNTAAEEAAIFLAAAGDQMRPGYLRPVLDLESGGGTLSKTELTDFAIAFNTAIYNATGVTPIIYANSNYAQSYVDSRISVYDFWLARYPSTNGAALYAAAPTATPAAGSYGAFATAANPTPWDFWQYSSAGTSAQVPGITTGIDLDIANGDIEYVKDFIIPGVWTEAAGGNFGGKGKWNNYQNVADTLYFPDANSRAIISLPDASPTIQYNGMDRTVRSLQDDEAMTFTSGKLTAVQYANFSAAVQVDGGGLTAASISNTGTMTIAGGAIAAAGPFAGTGTTLVSGGTLAAASLAQASLTITGGATTIAGAVTTTAGTSVSAGTLNLGSMPAGTLAVTGAGLAKFTGTGGSKVASLTVASTAGLDVGLTEFAVDYSSASPLSAARVAINAGAIASSKSTPGVTTVAAVESKAKYGPSFTSAAWGDGVAVAVDATAVLVALALFGDVNFDRVVNLVDLTTLSNSFGKVGAVFTWQDGNFTADNSVTAADLALLGANYGRTLLADGTFTAANPQQYAIDVAGFANLVPEPASLAGVGLLGVALGRRRLV